ncbi:hypothetical protein F2Q70_00039425, partial [Brassica cretica]
MSKNASIDELPRKYPDEVLLGIFRGDFRQTSDPRNFLGNLFPQNSVGKFREISEERRNSEELFPRTCFVAPVIESLRLKKLVLIAVTRCVRPIFVNVPRMVYLPSLKFLILGRMVYSNAKSLHQLLSDCPVLEDLVLERNNEDNNRPFTLSVIVPSLQELTLKISRGYHFEGLVINTPSLKYFKILDYIEEYARDNNSNYSYYFEDTPKLEEADIESTYPDINKFVRSIRSVKRLSLCIRVNADEEALYHEGIVFDQLQHLKLCSCGPNWSKLLVRLLQDSPLLRDLEVYLNDDHASSRVDAPVSWQNQLDCVPTCLLASLETFKWTVVYGSQEEIDL